MEPRLKRITKARNTIDTWRGLEHIEAPREGAWYNEENLSAALYPRLSVRRGRAAVETVDGNAVTSVLAACGRDRLILLDRDGIVHAGGNSLVLLDGDGAAEIAYYRPNGFTVPPTVEDVEDVLTFANGFYGCIYFEYTGSAWGYYKGDGSRDGPIPTQALLNYGIGISGTVQPGAAFTLRVYRELDEPATTPRSMVSMGANVVILPDKMWVDAARLAAGLNMIGGTHYGYIEHTQTIAPVSLTLDLCNRDGDVYSGVVASATEPTQEGYWLDLSGQKAVLREWSVSMSMWTVIPSTYVRVVLPGYSTTEFDVGDVVNIALSDDGEAGTAEETAAVRQLLNSAHLIVSEEPGGLSLSEPAWYVLEGILPAASVQVMASSLTIARTMPQMQFVVECDNRLWGCWYGEKDGEIVNEIYACRLGDFRNWNVFQGLSTDAYVASRGQAGPFTGAAVLDGHPLFFRQDSVEKVFPSASGAHQIQSQSLDGINPGSAQSAVIIDDKLYYAGIHGIYVYTGTLPRLISAELGELTVNPLDVVAGRHGKRLYVDLSDGAYHDGAYRRMYVYDTQTGLWHKEDSPWATSHWADGMVTWENKLYMIWTDPTGESTRDTLFRVDGTGRAGVRWFCESGVLGLDVPQHKRIGRIVLRYAQETGARVRLLIQYDEDGQWRPVDELHGGSLRAGTINLWPRRCDTFRLRFEGVGGFVLISLTYDRQRMSDKGW